MKIKKPIKFNDVCFWLGEIAISLRDENQAVTNQNITKKINALIAKENDEQLLSIYSIILDLMENKK